MQAADEKTAPTTGDNKDNQSFNKGQNHANSVTQSENIEDDFGDQLLE